MRRRELIALLGAAVAWPFAARAQQPSGKVWRVAALYPGSWETASDQAPFDAFRERLQTLGYIEGKNLVIDRRGAGGAVREYVAALDAANISWSLIAPFGSPDFVDKMILGHRRAHGAA